jgi:hypothetical protein
MKKPSTLWMSALIAIALGACGGTGAAPPREPDEVTETWTAGDDAPLGDDGAEAPSSEKGHFSIGDGRGDASSLRAGDHPGGPKT